MLEGGREQLIVFLTWIVENVANSSVFTTRKRIVGEVLNEKTLDFVLVFRNGFFSS